jgi:hypothetical protein
VIREGDACHDPGGRWVIRPYRQDDEGRILELFTRVFRVERSLAHWRWKFQENPAGRCLRVAETPAGELVGQYAGLPVSVAWGERTLVFTQIIDVMVDPRFRLGLKRPGLFSALANRFIADYGGPDKISGGYGFPTPDHLRIGQRVAGYIPVHPVVGLVRELGRDRVDRAAGNAGRVRIQEIARFGAEADGLWERLRPDLVVAAVRDARYLNWRYADCPDVRYRLVVAFDRATGAASGLAVLRLGVRDRPVCALVEFLVSGRDAAASLLAHCEGSARDVGMERLEAWFPPSSGQARWFREAGFREEPTIYQLVALPTNPQVRLDWGKDRWYYTMGDSDIY